ncbi:MAG: histidinol phosphatase [Flavobacteriaceae bacterium]|nr:histidinol phosphatase [Flavobacteriaceae bacterium]
MLSIFQKKEYLIDHLDGITDIHNHILPGIDDGAANIEDSLNLLLKFKDIGIHNFIASPHIMNDYYPNTPQTINAALEKLKDKIAQIPELKDVKIRAAAEYMMDQSFMELLESEKLLTLKDNFVLVEMSYFQAPINLNEILFQLQTKGYKPVLAHPERYAFYHSKDLRKYEELKDRGCLMQLNTLSLTSHYGTNMQQTAFRLLETGMYDFIGSDTHRIQHLEKLAVITLNKKISGPLKKVIAKTKEYF